MKKIKLLVCLMVVLLLNTSFVNAEVNDNHTHSYGEAKVIVENNLEKQIEECTTCGYINVLSEKEHTHVYSEWEITKEATEDEPGTKTRKCLVEGCTHTETMSHIKVRNMYLTYIFLIVGALMIISIIVIIINKRRNKKNERN